MVPGEFARFKTLDRIDFRETIQKLKQAGA
jgi:hypothetical protein